MEKRLCTVDRRAIRVLKDSGNALEAVSSGYEIDSVEKEAK